MKQLNGGKQMTSVWQIPPCTGSERIKDEQGKNLFLDERSKFVNVGMTPTIYA